MCGGSSCRKVYRSEAWRGMERPTGAICCSIELLQWTAGSAKGPSRMKNSTMPWILYRCLWKHSLVAGLCFLIKLFFVKTVYLALTGSNWLCVQQMNPRSSLCRLWKIEINIINLNEIKPPLLTISCLSSLDLCNGTWQILMVVNVFYAWCAHTLHKHAFRASMCCDSCYACAHQQRAWFKRPQENLCLRVLQFLVHQLLCKLLSTFHVRFSWVHQLQAVVRGQSAHILMQLCFSFSVVGTLHV